MASWVSGIIVDLIFAKELVIHPGTSGSFL
jgi:hypothetical protein